MNIFAILYVYPPLQTPATMCYVKLLEGLRKNGSKVTVLTVNPDSFYFPGGGTVDPDLVNLLPDGIVNHAVWSWEGNPVVRRLQENDLSHRLLHRFFEPRKVEWTYPAKRLLDQLDFSGFDLILSCSQPHCNHLLGSYLKRRTGKPWLAYFSDPWTDNVYANFRSEKILDYNRRLEGEVIRDADSVMFTTEEMKNLVMKKYPAEWAGKCGSLPHSFVPEWYELEQAPQEVKKAELTLIHTGHFYGPRTPLPLLHALARLDSKVPLAGRVEVRLYGTMEQQYRDYIDANLAEVVSVRAPVPYLQSLAAMRQADYLLLVDAPLAGTNESVFLPSKLVDYLGSGRPIIGITPRHGASARVLTETGNMVCDVLDQEDICRLLESVVTGAACPQLVPQAMEGYSCTEVARTIQAVIERVR